MKTLLDIGANIGKFSLANKENYDNFILVEGNPLLKSQLENINLENKEVIMKLVSNEKDPEFYISPINTISTCYKKWVDDCRFSNEYTWEKSTEKIETITLDTLVETYNPDFIKIDVEGYEYEVLQSLTKYAGDIAFEWSEELKDELINSIKYLNKLGYDKFIISLEDDYNFYPDKNSYYNLEKIFSIINNNFIDGRKALWGMVYCY
jgi:FkbM family methyltransferase